WNRPVLSERASTGVHDSQTDSRKLMHTARILLTVLAFGSMFAVAAPAAAQARAWYMAPGGDDAAAGSIEQPFATIQRAQRSAAPGDTVFIRGGTYLMKESQIARRKGIYAYITVLDKSGAPEKPITYRAWQEEKPVFDCSQVKPAGLRVDAFRVTGSWLHLLGIEVIGVQVTLKTHTQSICF